MATTRTPVAIEPPDGSPIAALGCAVPLSIVMWAIIILATLYLLTQGR